MGGEPSQADRTAQALHRFLTLARRARRQGHSFAQIDQRARHAVGERRTVDGAGNADDGGNPVGKCGIFRQRLESVYRALGVGHQDQGFSRWQRHDLVANNFRVGVDAMPSPCLDIAGRIALRLEVRGGVREHLRQIGHAFGEQPGHNHHSRARRDAADGDRPAGRRRFALQAPQCGAVLAWPVVGQGGAVIAADRAVDFPEPAAAIGDPGLVLNRNTSDALSSETRAGRPHPASSRATAASTPCQPDLLLDA